MLRHAPMSSLESVQKTAREIRLIADIGVKIKYCSAAFQKLKLPNSAASVIYNIPKFIEIS